MKKGICYNWPFHLKYRWLLCSLFFTFTSNLVKMETPSDKVRIFVRTVGVGHRLSVIKLVMKADLPRLPHLVSSICFVQS